MPKMTNKQKATARQAWIDAQLADPPPADECLYTDLFTPGKHGRPIWRNVYVARRLMGLGIGDAGVARHSCHEPRCVNISHLSVGTPADNSADMVSAGRSLTGESNPCYGVKIEAGFRPIPIALDSGGTMR